MQKIIDPVPVKDILPELTPDRLLRRSNKGDNEIYVVDSFNAPNTMREIGRLREIAFRDAGGGTGKDCDIDEFDTMPKPCRQLIVWSPSEKKNHRRLSFHSRRGHNLQEWSSQYRYLPHVPFLAGIP